MIVDRRHAHGKGYARGRPHHHDGARLGLGDRASGSRADLAYRRPRPLVAEGIALAPHVTAMMDVSDGLLLDAWRMGAASGATLAIDSTAVPIAAPENRRSDAMRWGDDYQLLFTASHDADLPVPATRIGTVAEGPARLALDGHYDGVPFHRVLPNFMAQTGDIVARDGTGEPGFTIRTELTQLPFEAGVVGMANLGSLDSENSQFFITHSRQPHLARGFTAFGWVSSGMDVVDLLEPLDAILSATVVPG